MINSPFFKLFGLTEKRIEKTKNILDARILYAVLIAKLSPLTGPIGAVAIGAFRPKFKRFFYPALVISIIKSSFFILLGYYSGQAYLQLNKVISKGEYIILGIIVLVFLIYIIYVKAMGMIVRSIKIGELERGAEFIANRILHELRVGKKVLWFMSGGSAIQVAVLAAKKISLHTHDNLTITLVDERYGAVGHTDSNWEQLVKAGFNLQKAKLIPVLNNNDFLETAKIFSATLEQELKAADYIIGLFGIGSDGHTAGILPNSPAVAAKDLVCAYEADNGFKRITITPTAILRFNEVVLFAQGESKWGALEKLKQDVSLDEQPAQVLKKLDKFTLFTDYKN